MAAESVSSFSALGASSCGDAFVLLSPKRSSPSSETADRSSRKRRTTSSVWAHTREPRSAEPIRCGRKNERIYYCAYCNDPSYSTVVSTTFRHHLLKVHGIELEA